MKLLLHTIFQGVKSDFCSLIDFKLRGETIEIITAIPTITSSYVSVFVSEKDNTFIVSDGGWVANNMYEGREVEDSVMLERISIQYKSHFKIKETKSLNGVVYYYKTTTNLELVSALVFDVGYFVSAMVNSQNISYKDETEGEDKQMFHNNMNSFLKKRFGQTRVETNSPVKVNEKYTIRFNAVVRAGATENYFIMYVTGARPNFFIKDLAEATVNFQIINDYAIQQDYFKKFTLINTNALGYDEEKSEIYVDRLTKLLDRPPILISNDSDMSKVIAALPVDSKV